MGKDTGEKFYVGVIKNSSAKSEPKFWNSIPGDKAAAESLVKDIFDNMRDRCKIITVIEKGSKDEKIFQNFKNY